MRDRAATEEIRASLSALRMDLDAQFERAKRLHGEMQKLKESQEGNV